MSASGALAEKLERDLSGRRLSRSGMERICVNVWRMHMRCCDDPRGKKGSKTVRKSDSKGSSGDEFFDSMGCDTSQRLNFKDYIGITHDAEDGVS